jgi:hypothetical protein
MHQWRLIEQPFNHWNNQIIIEVTVSDFFSAGIRLRQAGARLIQPLDPTFLQCTAWNFSIVLLLA